MSESPKWTPDILGEGYEATTVRHPDDYDGKVVSTVVRLRTEQTPSRGVLYVHGFNDYFFQAEMGHRFSRRGYGFYAVDLRKYGRSILPGQTMFRAKSLTEYFPDIESAIDIMKREGVDKIILMGHSTGGLITSLFMGYGNPAAEIKALVLNSPFLAWNLPPLLLRIGIPAVKFLSHIFPRLPVSPGGTEKYPAAISARLGGEWHYREEWKPDRMPKVDASWVRAVDTAQRAVATGRISVPVLLLHSDKSAYPSDPSELFHRADGVLDVKSIAAAGKKLGPDVTEVTVTDGLHDLLLSPRRVRDEAYDDIFRWLDGLHL